MNNIDHRIRHDDGDRSIQHGGGPPYQQPDTPQPEFNLLVAGCRGGKTSFLRLLLDTSVVSPRTTKDQLASVAKFVQGCSGHTSYIRSVSVDVNFDQEAGGQHRTLALTLMDTPSLDFKDEAAAERLLGETMRHIDARFAEGVEDEWKAKSGYRYVHLCIYFLDPDQIVPPSVPGPHVPLIPRGRANSFSQPDHEPVILEPPVSANPLRPSLPAADVAAIRRLSGRVNVLPVIARADVLSNERLAAVKLAIRRDLAEAGIGFGIFDTDPPLTVGQDDMAAAAAAGRPDSSNGYHAANGAPANSTPPTSPTAPPLLRLPYALASPDMYSHSDGVPRRLPARHELVQQYTPSAHYSASSVFPRGKFLRSYRWGSLDVLDPAHSDFVSLRTAIFHHMETLQRYTQMYLFEKFRNDYIQSRPSPIHNISHNNIQHMPPMGHAARPILAIDTAPPHPPHRHTVPAQPHRDVYPGDIPQRTAPPPRPMPDPTPTSSTSRTTAPRVKPRTKKITVACNFCRSRKLKCDGGRPTCGQCLKRSHPCDYMPQNKRRGTQRARKGDESGSDSGDERSPDGDEPSVSPELMSQPPSRRSSNVGRPPLDSYPSAITSMSAMSDRRGGSSAGSSARPKLDSGSTSAMASARAYFPDNEVPHIATLASVEPPPTPAPMSAPTLPPIRPASDLQAAQRKRAATVPGKIARQSTSSGPKVVACNFCRTRKTKCDGAHPACASCARRQLDCSYVHDSNGSSGSGHRKARRPSSSKAPTVDSPGSISPPSSRMVPTPSTGNDAHDSRDVEMHLGDEIDLKRPMAYDDSHRSLKKMRIDNTPARAGIP